MLPELTAMDAVAKILAPLTPAQRQRVVAWLSDIVSADDFDAAGTPAEAVAPIVEPVVEVEDVSDDDYDEYDDYDEADEYEEEVEEPALDTIEAFAAAIAPKTAIQKILTAGYWLETREGESSWRTFAVNKLLKNAGIELKHASNVLYVETHAEAPRVDVMSKTSDSAQARKTYRLNAAGRAFVESRLNANN